MTLKSEWIWAASKLLKEKSESYTLKEGSIPKRNFKIYELSIDWWFKFSWSFKKNPATFKMNSLSFYQSSDQFLNEKEKLEND